MPPYKFDRHCLHIPLTVADRESIMMAQGQQKLVLELLNRNLKQTGKGERNRDEGEPQKVKH